MTGATIYSEFILNDGTENIISRIKNSNFANSHESLEQLIQIAVKLDRAGYLTLNFLGDLIYDSDRSTFLYIDGGFDLGEKSQAPRKNALDTLLQTFRSQREYIEARYNKLAALQQK